MPFKKYIPSFRFRPVLSYLAILLIINCMTSCKEGHAVKRYSDSAGMGSSAGVTGKNDEFRPVYTMLISPGDPAPGAPFRVIATGGENIRKARLIITGSSEVSGSLKVESGDEPPYWRIDDFKGFPEGRYKAILTSDNKEVSKLEFSISPEKKDHPSGPFWKTARGWDSKSEVLYSVWINALFHGCGEDASWTALHEVIRDKKRNFLYNYLSLGEDDNSGVYSLIMQPDCADNPFFLRAYFAWKLSLPFGYHVCDRGWVGKAPKAGQWITNESANVKNNPVLSFNAFLRVVMNGVHSGTARTALEDENSDYYPVSLDREALRPGIVFADPYGHTLVIVSWIPETDGHPGLLLSADAQPDGTVGIKRFWKGNFLFNTSGVIGEPGFKAFRPITLNNGILSLKRNKDLTGSSGFVPFSLQQRRMKSDDFYHIMERLINPKPLDTETALLDLIEALHEQLLVRVTSVANGEAYYKIHPGAVIPMPSGAVGIFQAGGQWEDFSTPNRDLRLLIAMDAVLGFPDHVAQSPGDFKISGSTSPGQIRNELQSLLDRKVSEMSISYTRSDGSKQKLTLGEILERRDAFEMAYNPNDGIEIRWGAPENSEERAGCHRHAPPRQLDTMRSVRPWFHKRLHPPT